MSTIYSNINRILASVTILSLAILFSGCPLTSSSPLSNCTGDHKGELDFSNLTDKTAHVLIAPTPNEGSGSTMPPIDIAPGDNSTNRTVQEVQEGSYWILATDKASGSVLFQDTVTVACGESNSIDITGKNEPIPAPESCQNQGILGFANDTVEPVHIDLVGNPMAPSSVDLKALSSSILAVPVSTYFVKATGSSTGGILEQGIYKVKCLQNTIIEFNEPLWGTKQWGGVLASANTSSNGVTTDALGNVYVTGGTNAPLDGNKQTGTNDLFIIKYDAAGAKKWTKQLGVMAHDTVANDIAADALGNVYVVGMTKGALDKDPFGGGLGDFFITSYDLDGNNRWTRQLGGISGITNANAVALDTAGNVYIAGYTSASLDMNQKSGLQDLFIASYTTSGAKNWLKQFGAVGAQKATMATGIAIDAAGHIYVIGTTTGPLDNNQLIGFQDAFIINYNSSGDRKWTKQFGAGGGAIWPQGIVTDAVGNIYVTGGVNGSLDNNQQIGTADAFIANYTSYGYRKWSKQFGVVGVITEAQGGIAIDTSGNIYVAGTTAGSLDNNQLTGTRDVFVTSYTADGNKRRWTKQFGAVANDTGTSQIAIDAAGNIYVTGFTFGNLDNNKLTGVVDGFLTRFGSSGAKE